MSVIALFVWVAWAAASLPRQRAIAEAAYFDETRVRGDAPAMWNRPVEIKSADARPVSLSSVIPPGFAFAVSLEASIGGQPRRDIGTVTFTGNLVSVLAVPFGDESLLEENP